MHLVMVSRLVSDAYPRTMWCGQFQIEGHLVARYPFVEFGTHADLRSEPPFALPRAETGSTCQIRKTASGLALDAVVDDIHNKRTIVRS